jgi:hypothetical protein
MFDLVDKIQQIFNNRDRNLKHNNNEVEGNMQKNNSYSSIAKNNNPKRIPVIKFNTLQ